MPLEAQGPAPYAPGHCVMAFINHIRDMGIPSVDIDEDYIARIPDIGDSYVRRTMRALEILDLVDPSTHTATPTLEKIQLEASDQLPATLAEWFNSVYAEVVRFVSPKDDIEKITDQFRRYMPTGQKDRMVQLFLSLAEAAELIEKIPRRPRGASANAPKKKPVNQKTTKPDKPKEKVNPDPPDPPGDEDDARVDGSPKDRYLDLLMKLAEKADGAPAPELLDRIERVLGVQKQGEQS